MSQAAAIAPDAASQPITAESLKDAAAQLVELLKLRTLPIGMKQFQSVEEMMAIPSIRTPTKGKHFSTCQLVTQARVHGFTLGITVQNVRGNSNCSAVIGLDSPHEDFLNGKRMNGVWFDNQEAARMHQETMPRARAGSASGVAAAPLRSARLNPPDICLFYANPAQMILFVNGLQHHRYRRYDFTITGESACADSWGRALATGQTSLSIPCYAERRYGGVADDELLMACPPDEFLTGVRGLAFLSKNGLRYPIPPYGATMDPAEGLSKSYG
jgi:uncharacterized protein (DUF169 family)